MEPTDLPTSILREIRDEIRTTREELRAELAATREELSARIDHNGRRIDALSGRMVESEIRVATALTELAGAVGDVRTLLESNLGLRDRVSRCELDIAELKHKVGG